nr:hypothetical protein [Aerococcus urinae]
MKLKMALKEKQGLKGHKAKKALTASPQKFQPRKQKMDTPSPSRTQMAARLHLKSRTAKKVTKVNVVFKAQRVLMVKTALRQK